MEEKEVKDRGVPQRVFCEGGVTAEVERGGPQRVFCVGGVLEEDRGGPQRVFCEGGEKEEAVRGGPQRVFCEGGVKEEVSRGGPQRVFCEGGGKSGAERTAAADGAWPVGQPQTQHAATSRFAANSVEEWQAQLAVEAHGFVVRDRAMLHNLTSALGLDGKRAHAQQLPLEAGLGSKAVKPSYSWPGDVHGDVKGKGQCGPSKDVHEMDIKGGTNTCVGDLQAPVVNRGGAPKSAHIMEPSLGLKAAKPSYPWLAGRHRWGDDYDDVVGGALLSSTPMQPWDPDDDEDDDLDEEIWGDHGESDHGGVGNGRSPAFARGLEALRAEEQSLLHGPAPTGANMGAQGCYEEDQDGPLLLDRQLGPHGFVGTTVPVTGFPGPQAAPVRLSACAAPAKVSSLWGDPVGGQTDWLHLATGDQVVLHRLATTGLNGLRGRIVQLVEATARVAVCLDGGGGLKAVKPSNVRLDRESAGQGWADEGAGQGTFPSTPRKCVDYCSDGRPTDAPCNDFGSPRSATWADAAVAKEPPPSAWSAPFSPGSGAGSLTSAAAATKGCGMSGGFPKNLFTFGVSRDPTLAREEEYAAQALAIDFPRSVSDPVRGRAEWLPFAVGDPVVLYDLCPTHCLNGRGGSIECLDEKTSLITVRLYYGGGLTSVKPADMRLDAKLVDGRAQQYINWKN